MKKKRIAGLMLLMPLTLLCACGGGTSALAINANWYRNTSISKITGTDETLEYEITFTPPTNADSRDYYVVYEGGTYVTHLEDVSYEFEDKSSADVYRLTAEWKVKGYYVYNGGKVEKSAFEDTVTSVVWFRSAAEGFSPIKSIKTTYCNSPVSAPTAENLCTLYNFTYTVTYDTNRAFDASLSKATIAVDNLLTDEDDDQDTVEVSVSNNGRYLDNEQILFAFRGLEMDASESFKTINPQNNRNVSAGMAEKPVATVVTLEDFAVNGVMQGGDENEDGKYSVEINAFRVKYAYKTAQPGPTRTAYYAKKEDAANNTYRNVLLRYDDPLTNNYGTLTYLLKKATFNTK